MESKVTDYLPLEPEETEAPVEGAEVAVEKVEQQVEEESKNEKSEVVAEQEPAEPQPKKEEEAKRASSSEQKPVDKTKIKRKDSKFLMQHEVESATGGSGLYRVSAWSS